MITVLFCVRSCVILYYFIFLQITTRQDAKMNSTKMELQCITDIKKNFPLGFELGTCGVRGRRLTDVATETAGSWGETWYLSMLALTTVGAIRDTGGQIFVIDEQKKKTITRELWHFVLYYYHSCIFVVKMLISVLVLELSEEKKKNLENVYIEPYIWFRILPKYDFNNKYLLTHS